MLGGSLETNADGAKDGREGGKGRALISRGDESMSFLTHSTLRERAEEKKI